MLHLSVDSRVYSGNCTQAVEPLYLPALTDSSANDQLGLGDFNVLLLNKRTEYKEPKLINKISHV